MTFLDSKPDLSGTRFTGDDHRYAQEYLLHHIKRHEPEWLENPRGYLAAQWRSGTQYSACLLIHLAQVLFRADLLLGRPSIPFLIQKFRGLLRAANKKIYTETLSELEILWFFSDRFDGVRLEPRVPVHEIDAPNKPPGPDLALRLGDLELEVEVTVMYFAELDRWERAVDKLKNRIQKWAVAERLSRYVVLEASLGFQEQAFSQSTIKAILMEIGNADEGSINLRRFGFSGRLHWTAPSASEQHLRLGPYVLGDAGMKIQMAIAFSAKLVYRDNAELTQSEEALVRSLRATLDRKRAQLAVTPNMLVIRLGNRRIESEGFLDLIEHRIWPNPHYQRFSALALYLPPSTSGKEVAQLRISRNMNAVSPLSDELMSVLTAIPSDGDEGAHDSQGS